VDRVDKEINNNNYKHLLRSNTQGYGGKTHYTDSQNTDTTARSGRELYHLQFLLQAASPETFGYTLVLLNVIKILYMYVHLQHNILPRHRTALYKFNSDKHALNEFLFLSTRLSLIILVCSTNMRVNYVIFA
jgi:hypothetical protein